MGCPQVESSLEPTCVHESGTRHDKLSLISRGTVTRLSLFEAYTRSEAGVVGAALVPHDRLSCMG